MDKLKEKYSTPKPEVKIKLPKLGVTPGPYCLIHPRKAIIVKGEPLSETIIKERR